MNIIKLSSTKFKLVLKDPLDIMSNYFTSIFLSSEKEDSNTIVLYANSITFLKPLLSDPMQLIFSLKRQQEFLEKHGYSFYALNVEDIIVINDSIFVCINSNLIKAFKEGTCLLSFYKPYDRPKHIGTSLTFFSPELDKKVLPAIVSYKTAYYSLGALIIYCLFGSDIKNKNIDEILLPIKYSKLYWFLKRCLDENPKNRYLIYV